MQLKLDYMIVIMLCLKRFSQPFTGPLSKQVRQEEVLKQIAWRNGLMVLPVLQPVSLV